MPIRKWLLYQARVQHDKMLLPLSYKLAVSAHSASCWTEFVVCLNTHAPMKAS